MKKILTIPLLAIALASSGTMADNTISTGNSAAADSYNPFEEMRKMQEEMDRVFAKFHQRMMQESLFKSFPSTFPSAPAIDLKDKGDHYLLEADVPGSKESEINVTARDGVLTIEAKSVKVEQKEQEKNDSKFIRHERFEGVYMRSLTLPQDADANQLKSDYKDGVLKIIIPKKK
jgi:HSP20 family protein